MLVIACQWTRVPVRGDTVRGCDVSVRAELIFISAAALRAAAAVN
jgi:hypothetical protein